MMITSGSNVLCLFQYHAPVIGFRHYLHVRFCFQQDAQPLPHDLVVVRQDDFNGRFVLLNEFFLWPMGIPPMLNRR